MYLERRLLADEAVHRVGGALGGRVAGDGGGGGGLDNGRGLLGRPLDDVGFVASANRERTLATRGSVQLGAAALDVEVARHKGAHCGCVCVGGLARGGDGRRYSTHGGMDRMRLTWHRSRKRARNEDRGTQYSQTYSTPRTPVLTFQFCRRGSFFLCRARATARKGEEAVFFGRRVCPLGGGGYLKWKNGKNHWRVDLRVQSR